MKEYNVWHLASAIGVLEAICKDLQYGDLLGGELDAPRSEALGKILGSLKLCCEALGMDPSFTLQIQTMSEQHINGVADLRKAVVRAKLKMILDTVDEALTTRKFFLLSEEEARFFANGKLFGDTFQSKYSLHAAREAICAGNCYAASEYTACVFHCMRVAEYGLRKLAANRILRVKLTKKGRPCPIEYATWQEVIAAIQSKIRAIRQRPIGAKRESELQFLSSAADHCEYMKDLWRNELSHTRRWYKKEEALAAINRVKEFVTAVGEHRSSAPAEDSLVRILAQAEPPPLPPPPSNLELLSRLLTPPSPEAKS